MMIVTAGPNDEARPTSQVGAVSRPIAKNARPTMSSVPLDDEQPEQSQAAALIGDGQISDPTAIADGEDRRRRGRRPRR